MLRRALLLLALSTASVGALSTAPAVAEPRLALVIGQGAYAGGALPTAVNDAGLVAQTLATAGFEVVQGRDLDTDELRGTVRGFLDKVKSSPADTAVVVYVAGHALQMDGDNFIVPVDARISRETDVAYDSLRLSDLTRALADAPGRTRVVVLDAARAFPTGSRGALSRGLAIVDPAPGFLLALAGAPGATAPEGAPPYGLFATALVETMREPGIGLDDLFSRVRLQVHEASEGRQTPFHAANLQVPFTFFEPEDATASAAPAPEADGEAAVTPASAVAPTPAAAPTRKVAIPDAGSVEEAYALAINTDTIEGYQAFLKLYGDTDYARRVKAILAARREATVWKRAVAKPSTGAYWTYLKTYPDGQHASDCRRGLARLGASATPPAGFEEIVYEDIPRPLPVEIVEIREAIRFVEDAPRPPRPPIYLLPRRLERIVLGAPTLPASPRALPVIDFLPLPPRVRLPERLPPIVAGPFGRPGLPDRRPGDIVVPRPLPLPGTGQAGSPPLPPNGNPGPFRPRPLPGPDQIGSPPLPPNGNPGPFRPRPLPRPDQIGSSPLPPNGNPGPFRPRPLPGPDQIGSLPLPPNGNPGPFRPRPLPRPDQIGSLPLPPNGNPGPFRPRPLPAPDQIGSPPLPPNGNPGPFRPRPLPGPGQAGEIAKLPGGGRPPIGTLPGRPPVQSLPVEARLPAGSTVPAGGRPGPFLPGGARFPRGRIEAGSRFPVGSRLGGERALPERRSPDTADFIGSRPPVVRSNLPDRFERLGPVGPSRFTPSRFEGPRVQSRAPVFRPGPGSFAGQGASPRSFGAPPPRLQPSIRSSGGGFGGGRFSGGFGGGNSGGGGGFGGGRF